MHTTTCCINQLTQRNAKTAYRTVNSSESEESVQKHQTMTNTSYSIAHISKEVDIHPPS